MEYTETENPIEYEWLVDGLQGAKFLLKPVRGTHTQDDLWEARQWLKSNHDAVSIKHEWQPKSSELCE